MPKNSLVTKWQLCKLSHFLYWPVLCMGGGWGGDGVIDQYFAGEYLISIAYFFFRFFLFLQFSVDTMSFSSDSAIIAGLQSDPLTVLVFPGNLIFCRTRFSMGDLGEQPSVHLSVRFSIRQHLPWVSCEPNSSYSFVPIFFKLCMCFRHGMRICMWFGYTGNSLYLKVQGTRQNTSSYQ